LAVGFLSAVEGCGFALSKGLCPLANLRLWLLGFYKPSKAAGLLGAGRRLMAGIAHDMPL
jgi:hypothetical protein